ncbi:MAG: pyrroline-5-carboxylate reductase [Candidatus Wallacebacter cryptica]|mgnify:CR=1 FL=1|nr:pyrroline-5-carboxylate reductase [Bacillota bacterium]
MRICLIGLGKMGSALLKGIVDAGLFMPEQITACDPLLVEAENNLEYFGIRTCKDLAEAVIQSDLIILAVKPQVFTEIAGSLAQIVKDKLVVSIMAGLSTTKLRLALGETSRIVRVMPNTPVLINAGVSAVTAGPEIDEQELQLVTKIFSTLGEVVEVDEGLMDAVTGLSGSGPAYIYVLIEAMADGAVAAGLPRELALKLAALTVKGAAQMVLETGWHPGALKDMVTSPAGTTIRGLEVLEEQGFRFAAMKAIKAGAERSRELNRIE